MTDATASRFRLGFAGTPTFAATILRTLLAHHEVAVVYCQPPRPTGRGRRIAPSAVEQLAREHGVAVRTPKSMRAEAGTLAQDRLDALIVAAYGLILPTSILETPRFGCVNVHASLLPRWRGAAPIERAIMAGDRVTGVSIMQMDAGLDTGPVLLQSECAIRDDDTGDTLHDRLAVVGASALIHCLEHLGHLPPIAQSWQGVTYAAKLAPEDSVIDWRAAASEIALKIRALNSRQPAFCLVNGERVRLLFAEPVPSDSPVAAGTVIGIDRKGLVVKCGSGAVRILRVALARGKGLPMDIAALINGYPDLLRVGQRLVTST
jgi:methionyl-tRNA formyltransferase